MVPENSANRDHRYTPDQLSHSQELRANNSCPTALACSISGELAFAAYTDDSLHLIDMRSPDTQRVFTSGGHTGMIKSIWISEDESLLYTGGSDGTVRIWDIGTRSVIQTYGVEKTKRGVTITEVDDFVEDLSYHTDSITTMMPSCLGGKVPNG